MEQTQTFTDFSIRRDEAIALLRCMPLLQQVPEDTLKKICQALQPVQYGPREAIVRRDSEGAGLYILWNGEANVVSPPNVYPLAHKESLLKRGDYFGIGIMGPVRRKYKVDVVAITEVICFVLSREHADLLSGTSIWNLDSKNERPSKFEKMLQFETVGAIGDMKMKAAGVPHYYLAFLEATKRPVSSSKVLSNYFGGQLISQALLAATKTVDTELLVHSLHSYFVQSADVHFPVVYVVERIRDGKSFATRHREEEGFEHAAPMPSVPAPEEVMSLDQVFDEHIIDPRLPLDAKKKYAGLKFDVVPVEMRHVNLVDNFQPEKHEPRQQIWIRSRSKFSGDQSFQRCVAAYATDLSILETCLHPHPETLQALLQMLSLDHTIWFHQSFDAAEWLLYVMESPVAGDGRGLSFGKLYTQDGRLVMTVAQEGLLRPAEGEILRVAKL